MELTEDKIEKLFKRFKDRNELEFFLNNYSNRYNTDTYFSFWQFNDILKDNVTYKVSIQTKNDYVMTIRDEEFTGRGCGKYIEDFLLSDFKHFVFICNILSNQIEKYLLKEELEQSLKTNSNKDKISKM